MFEDKVGLATLVSDQWFQNACVAKVSEALRSTSCHSLPLSGSDHAIVLLRLRLLALLRGVF